MASIQHGTGPLFYYPSHGSGGSGHSERSTSSTIQRQHQPDANQYPDFVHTMGRGYISRYTNTRQIYSASGSLSSLAGTQACSQSTLSIQSIQVIWGGTCTCTCACTCCGVVHVQQSLSASVEALESTRANTRVSSIRCRDPFASMHLPSCDRSDEIHVSLVHV